MPTLDWLKKEFHYGYGSGDILSPENDEERRSEELRCGADYRLLFLDAVAPHVKPGCSILELGPGKGSWTRAFLRFSEDCSVQTVDFQDVTQWLRPESWNGRLRCHRVTDSSFSCIEPGSIDLFFSFGVLCHNNRENIEAILRSTLSRMKPGGIAIHQHGDWRKLDAFGWENGGVPREFQTKPDDEIWWPRNDGESMEKIALAAGWEVVARDLGYIRRDGFMMLRAPGGAPATSGPRSSGASSLDEDRVFLRQGVAALEAGNPALALDMAIRAKALRRPTMGLDMMRATAFLMLGRRDEGVSALREELRHFPDNQQARELFESLPEARTAVAQDGSEFRELLAIVRPYTMLSEERLESLYRAALDVCREDRPGNIVECGVAAGGSSALLAAVVARHSRRPRKVFSLDTFEGMPPPTAEDAHQGNPADATGWGTGTCAAPVDSLLEACERSGGRAHVVPVKGLFQETLPVRKAEMGVIALLHMDGDWYDSTMAILREVYDQVDPGCFIQIDDYGHWDGCRKAVHEFEAARGLKFALTRIDATGAWMRKPADTATASIKLSAVRAIDQGGVWINVGCGARFARGWRNFDIVPASPEVESLDSRLHLPFADGTVDLAYSSHMLEHLSRDDARSFVQECFRVLRPGGIARIVVPDLEGIVRSYLRELEAAVAGDASADVRREWMVTELLDQVARHRSGGDMLKWWAKDPVPAEEFIIQRVGSEARGAIADLRRNPSTARGDDPRDPQVVGAFRLSGEIHRWMYDRHSLGQLLKDAGFTDPKVVSASSSAAPGWNSFLLDTETDGSVRKPDSLFMEATR